MEAIRRSVAARSFRAAVRSRQAFTAAASMGLPLWKVTPSRSVIVHVS